MCEIWKDFGKLFRPEFVQYSELSMTRRSLTMVNMSQQIKSLKRKLSWRRHFNKYIEYSLSADQFSFFLLVGFIDITTGCIGKIWSWYIPSMLIPQIAMQAVELFSKLRWLRNTCNYWLYCTRISQSGLKKIKLQLASKFWNTVSLFKTFPFISLSSNVVKSEMKSARTRVDLWNNTELRRKGGSVSTTFESRCSFHSAKDKPINIIAAVIINNAVFTWPACRINVLKDN